jgi:hypothetical protein
MHAVIEKGFYHEDLKILEWWVEGPFFGTITFLILQMQAGD